MKMTKSTTNLDKKRFGRNSLDKTLSTKAFQCVAFFILLLNLNNYAQAANQNMQKLGDNNVHYIALNSTFLTPEIATSYGITRSKVNALINISVLDNTLENTPAKSVGLVGTATNLLGQKKQLEFVEVKEGDAIYYLAELKFTHEDQFRFNIQIFDSGKNQTLKFNHKFYVD